MTSSDPAPEQTPIISAATGVTYPDRDAYYAAEANGYCVVSILEQTSRASGKPMTFARVLGPFGTQKEAQNNAARLRRRFKATLSNPNLNPQGTRLIRVTLEPILKELNP